MTPKSAKAKGRRLAQEVAEMLLVRGYGLEPGDIAVVPSGLRGRDLQLSPAALIQFPFAIECKNVERLQVWEAMDQARAHKQCELEIPIVFFRRNRSKIHVVLEADEFLKLLHVSPPVRRS